MAQMMVQEGARVRMMRQVMARMVKGEIGMRLVVWRTAVQDEVHGKQLRLLQDGLEARMMAQGQGAGVTMMKQAMARMVKGEVGMRLVVWRTAVQDEARAKRLGLLQA